jgi:hypothetical protein
MNSANSSSLLSKDKNEANQLSTEEQLRIHNMDLFQRLD